MEVCTPYQLMIHLMQTLMSVPPTMEDVSRCVLTPLVASTAAVGQATCWMGMDSTAMVSNDNNCL